MLICRCRGILFCTVVISISVLSGCQDEVPLEKPGRGFIGIVTVFAAQRVDSKYPVTPTADLTYRIVTRDSILIAGELYTIVFKINDTLYIINRGDTIAKYAHMSPYFSFEDANGDSFKDIVINDPMAMYVAMKQLLLYDSRRKCFVEIVDYAYFPDPTRINKTQYYYSYHHSGCADMNWDSDLFIFRNDSAVSIGRISGRECVYNELEDGIYIYKMNGDSSTLYKTKSIDILQNYKDYKWGFITEYWNQNYWRFDD